MAIVSLGQVSSFALTTGTLVATLPTGIVAGTVLKAILTQDTPITTFGVPSGWTIDRTDVINNGDGQTYAKLTRVSDGTDGTTVTFTASSGTRNMACVIGAWNGVDNTTTERDFSFSNPNLATPPNSPVTLTATTITPNAGDQLVFMGGVDTNNGNGVFTGPAGYSAPVQVTSAQGFTAAMIAEQSAAGGATGSVSATWTAATLHGNFVTYFIALKAAGVGAALVGSAQGLATGAGSLSTAPAPFAPILLDDPAHAGGSDQIFMGNGVPGSNTGDNMFIGFTKVKQWAIDANANFAKLFPVRSLQAPVTGFAIAVAKGVTQLVLNPAGTLASGTLTLPPTPGDNQTFTAMTSQTITALTVNTTDGTSIAAAPTTLSNTSALKLRFQSAANIWFREQ